MRFGVVGDLLSEISAAEKDNSMRITWLDRNQITRNPRNGYEISEVEELAADIKRSGLGQPLEVLRQKDGSYRLITGERRLTAIDILIHSGDWKGEIPCVVRELGDYDLPLSDELKEIYAIIRTNKFSRKLSDADLFFEATKWEEIIRELKKNGRSEARLEGEDGSDVSVDIRGRAREAVARTMNVSNGQVAKIERIQKKGIPDVREAVREGRMKIAAAYELSGLDQERQKEFMRENEGNACISTEQIVSFQEEMERKDSTSDVQESSGGDAKVEESQRNSDGGANEGESQRNSGSAKAKKPPDGWNLNMVEPEWLVLLADIKRFGSELAKEYLCEVEQELREYQEAEETDGGAFPAKLMTRKKMEVAGARLLLAEAMRAERADGIPTSEEGGRL